MVRFCTPTFHAAKSTVQNQHRYFSVIHLFLTQLRKMPSSWDGVLGACSPAFWKGQESIQAHPWCAPADILAGVLRMQIPCCSISPCEDEQQLFTIHLGQARDIMKERLKFLHSIQFFHVCIKKCILRPYLPLMGRIFNNTSKY